MCNSPPAFHPKPPTSRFATFPSRYHLLDPHTHSDLAPETPNVHGFAALYYRWKVDFMNEVGMDKSAELVFLTALAVWRRESDRERSCFLLDQVSRPSALWCVSHSSRSGTFPRLSGRSSLSPGKGL